VGVLIGTLLNEFARALEFGDYIAHERARNSILPYLSDELGP